MERYRAKLNIKEIPFTFEEKHRSIDDFMGIDSTLDTELAETFDVEVPYQTTWCVNMMLRTYFTLTNNAPKHIIESEARKAQKILFKELFTPILMELSGISRAINAGDRVEAQKRIASLENAIICSGE